MVYGARHRDLAFQEIPAPAIPVFCEDHHKPEAILTALHRAGFADRQFTAVQTTIEPLLITASVLGRALGARVLSPSTAVLFRDKFLQKQRIVNAGLDTARSVLIEDLFALGAGFTMPFERAVLKPVTGLATQTTSAVDGLDELLATARRYRQQRISTRTFVLEEFITGDEWTADGVVSDGELLFYGLGRYEQPCLTTLQDKAPLSMRKFDPQTESWAYEAADHMVREALGALGLTDGVFHMELFHDPRSDRVVFSECAARRGGALTEEEILAKFGVDLGEAAVQCALGWKPEVDVRVRAGTVGSVYFTSRPGTLAGCPSPAELTELPGVSFARIELPIGYRMAGAADSTTTRIGMAMITAADPQSLERRRAEVLQWFDERLVVIPAATTSAELRDWRRKTHKTDEFADVLYGA
ncbi:ATP-grasp domain-containing protein [Nonomuraea sp. K274]|uniref:ATP-grasp domain-containing protein n=1 Tax=Nonomuraea cypriaca TaxID=1187855 RepID=A0A931AJ97_9ACTN|nr:ATP-grasp domain-containing protein [Nonomuraea cypriaca]MBF8194052.1 ATP-grasp domain-containing protein [Nonomuraea cypriaca]